MVDALRLPLSHYGFFGEPVDIGWLHSMVIYLRRILSCEPLRNPVKGCGIEARHGFCLRGIRPGRGRKHQKSPICASLKEPAAGLFAFGKAHILKCYKPQIALAVYVENGGFGATYAVPIGALIMEQYLTGTLSETSKIKAAEMQNRVIYYGESER